MECVLRTLPTAVFRGTWGVIRKKLLFEINVYRIVIGGSIRAMYRCVCVECFNISQCKHTYDNNANDVSHTPLVVITIAVLAIR